LIQPELAEALNEAKATGREKTRAKAA